MKAILLEQGSQEWLAWRKGGIGSSDATVIAADAGMVEVQSWMDSIDELYEEKLSDNTETEVNERMLRGTKLEPFARNAFERASGLAVSPMCGTMDENDMVRASFDGTDFDQLSFLELKAPNDEVHELAKSGVVVDYYRPQIAHQALVLWGEVRRWPKEGRVMFGTYMPDDEDVPEKGTLHRVTIPAMKKGFREYAEALYARELRFIDNLKNRVPPCGAEYAALAAEWQAAKDTAEGAAAYVKQVEEKMKELASQRDIKRLTRLGITTSETCRRGTIDYPKLCAEHGIDDTSIERYRKQGSSFWSVRRSRKGEKAANAKAAAK